MRRNATIWLVVGVAFIAAVATQGWAKELYILGGLVTAYGVLLLVRTMMGNDGGFQHIMDDLQDMPPTMRQLAIVQFFSWFALFAMWIYTTGAVTSVHYGSSDTTSASVVWSPYRSRSRSIGRGSHRSRRSRPSSFSIWRRRSRTPTGWRTRSCSRPTAKSAGSTGDTAGSTVTPTSSRFLLPNHPKALGFSVIS